MALEENTIPEIDPFTGDKNEYFATLVRGHRYTLGTNLEKSVMFREGEDHPVSAKTMAILKRRAVDTVSIGPAEEGEQEDRQKFKFRKIGDPVPVEKPSGPRVRRRVHHDQ